MDDLKAIQNSVPDSIRPYLNEIAERLWAERAAVMVGAGFSKNAGNGFPDWNNLGDLFYQKAHGVTPDPVKQKYLNVLRLAEEFQAAIGRPALENLLRSSIPDLNIEPSNLHVELLELPWADVFTTNYDTLLERASAKVVTRRYEPVVNKEDIPYAIKPRIVKLHGSFPSERPFIITEEDYRRYPYDYAPFVNTVQQALLENTFCLIGFSGDDPNFLQWIGWIRDNLGKDKTQKIYLVGVFNLSSARLQLLAQRGIIVVDLSCCDGIEKTNHKKALSLFFDFIRSKKPDAPDWPGNAKTMFPTEKAISVQEIQMITEEWKRQRQSYPEWLILPYENRKDLWAFTEMWVDHLPNMENSPPGLDIQYAFELIWRLERCLLPVFNNYAEFCEKLLQKYWPFKNTHPPVNCQIHTKEVKFQYLPWDDLRQAWLSIAVSMLRFYREEGYLDKWKDGKMQIESLSDHLSDEQREFLKYEGFLFSLFTLDLPNAKQCLENWQPNEAQPYWMTKRAAAFAEIGLLNEAETIARESLEHIRKKLNQKVEVLNFTSVSQESYSMILGKYIQDAVSLEKRELGKGEDRRTQFNDRWNQLKRFKCDPWSEIKLFELTLKNPPIATKIVTEKREFDIGMVTQTRHFIRADREAFSGYMFLRFCEEVGLPYRIGNYTLTTKTALASLERISQYSPFWAIATLARLGDANAVDCLFNREAVYRFTVDEADRLVQNYLDALDKCRDEIKDCDASQKNTYGARLAQLLPEVISRLCCKCSDKMKQRILEFIAEIYASPNKTNYRNIYHLTNRLIDSLSEFEQFRLVPELLKIPFPDNLNLIVKRDFVNPLLLLELNHKPECVPALEIQPELVDHLLSQAVLNNSDRRRWAITSLVKLYELKLLNDSQSKCLATVIWSKIDRDGLPENTDFFKFAFLDLPHPEDIDPVQLFKNYVKATPFPIEKNKQYSGTNITGGNIPIIHEILGANKNTNFWTEEDATEILQRLIKWWDDDKERLREKEKVLIGFTSTPQEFQARFSKMLKLVAAVIGPKLQSNSSDEIKTSLIRLLKEVREYELPSLAAEAACLHIYPDHKADICDRINEGLLSNQKNIKKDALNAINIIILNGNNSEIMSMASNPRSILCQYLSWSSTSSIGAALSVVIDILKNSPASFSQNIKKATERRLHRLLIDTAYDSNNSYLKFDEKLEIRRISSILTATLWKHHCSNRLPIPDAVEKWRIACLSPDEFSEIQNPWINVKY